MAILPDRRGRREQDGVAPRRNATSKSRHCSDNSKGFTKIHALTPIFPHLSADLTVRASFDVIYCMNTAPALGYLPRLLLALPILMLAQLAQAQTFRLVAQFDYPGSKVMDTTPSEINDSGEVVGWFCDPTHVSRGFVRNPDGTFSEPLVDPKDTGNSTFVSGLNNSGTICGYYDHLFLGDNIIGFFLSHGVYRDFAIPNQRYTYVTSLNDAGDFVGSYDNGDLLFPGFISVAGVTTTFSIPGHGTTPGQINNSGEVVGTYLDNQFYSHGFYRDAAGTLTYPIDVPGAANTHLIGMNDKGQIVGSYTIQGNHTHGLLMTLAGEIVTYDYPGAKGTVLTGINNNGAICGSVNTKGRIIHGILLQFKK